MRSRFDTERGDQEKMQMGNEKLRRKSEKNRVSNRIELVALAQKAAEQFAYPAHRVVVIVTDADGDFVGVGMNTSGDDADRIMRCAIAGEGLTFHQPDGYSRQGTIRPTLAAATLRTVKKVPHG